MILSQARLKPDMASRNQNRPPRSPSNTAALDKLLRVGAERIDLQGTTVRGRQPFASVNKGPEANPANDVGSTEGLECSIAEFMKEDVEALLNEKMKKGNPFDSKKKMEQMGDLIRRLKLCVKWFKKLEESYVEEKEKLQSALESAERKCTDTETEMKNKIEELSVTISDLRKTNSTLEEQIAEAIDRHREEKEARSTAEKNQVSLSTELEKVQQEKLAAEQKASSYEELYNRLVVYNESLQQYNSKLQSELESTKESNRNLEKDKATIIKNLGNLRGQNMTLQKQLASVKMADLPALEVRTGFEEQEKSIVNELQDRLAEKM